MMIIGTLDKSKNIKGILAVSKEVNPTVLYFFYLINFVLLIFKKNPCLYEERE